MVGPLYLIRHGETDWNREARFQGQVDIPINELGRKQAAANGRLLANRIENPEEWDFVCSPLGRTRETMEIIRREMGLPIAEYRTDDLLIEVTFGEWERQRLADLEMSYPALVRQRDADKWNFVPPKGESYADAAKRAERFLQSIHKPSIIVTHGGIIRAMRHLLENLDGQEAATGAIPQDTVYFHDKTHSLYL